MKYFIFILIGILSMGLCAQPAYSSEDPSISPPGKLRENGTSQTILPESLSKAVDSIMTFGIEQKAFPGGQVLVAWKGEVIFHKAYGFHTYDSIQAVSLNDLYDLASVTKIIGPLPALMKLYEEGKLDLDIPFSTYWKPWRRSKDKKDLTLREILAHQAGLKPYIVFLNEVMKGDRLKRRYIHRESNPRFKYKAFDSLFVRNTFKNRMYKAISRSQVSSEKIYRYSGLTFLLFPEIISQLSGQSYEYYLQKNFYLPLGATGLVFNPKSKNLPNAIVPTEKDTIYRKAVVQGWVHDENASLMGGVSGNAGLFGKALDLQKIMQLYQNYGKVNGTRYLQEQTVREFTSVQFPENDNRRGLGFDKPLIDNRQMDINESYPAPDVSRESFGHSGFTGTFVWADPKYQLVYIFLSNRVYPTRSHRKLYELSIRSAIQQLFYQALSDL